VEARAAVAAGKAYLFKPEPAIRVRYGTNDPTPWPPETPAGENPPPGGIIDYLLAKDAGAPVKMEILDQMGHVVRHYSSDMPARNPDPALDPEAYNKVCLATPSAPDCGLPLYWPAPQLLLSDKAGPHRFGWDLHFDPIGEEQGFAPGGSAVPHHTFPNASAPWAPPGQYTVRLTVDGAAYNQPITLKLDPRVRTQTVQLLQVSRLTKELYYDADTAHMAYLKARSLSEKLGAAGGDAASLKAQIDTLAPANAGGGRGGRGGGFAAAGGRGGRGGGGGGGGAPIPAPTLPGSQAAALAAANAFGSSEMAPTKSRLDAAAKAKADVATALTRWKSLSGAKLAALNTKRKAAGEAVITP
jgi:hypothetical protein